MGSDDYYRMLFEHVGVGIAVVEDDDGFLCRGDDKLFRIFIHPSRLIYDIESLECNLCDDMEEIELYVD